jgi:hypothetical protein
MLSCLRYHYGVGMICLRSLKYGDCGFEPHSRYGCLSVFLLCQQRPCERADHPTTVYKIHSSGLILMGNRPEDLTRKWPLNSKQHWDLKWLKPRLWHRTEVLVCWFFRNSGKYTFRLGNGWNNNFPLCLILTALEMYDRGETVIIDFSVDWKTCTVLSL